MAQVFDSYSFLPGGAKKKNLEHLIARHIGVQGKLDSVANELGGAAKRRLAHHRHDGDAEILVERGRIDRYVVLSDMKGLKAALSIEYGRKPDAEGKGGMAPLHILSDSVAEMRKR